MSKRVLFVCLSLFVIGLLSAWDIFLSLLNGRPNATVAVLFLPASLGLMLGFRFARTAACWVFILSYLTGAGALLMPLFATAGEVIIRDSRRVAWMSPYPLLLVSVLIALSFFAFLHWLLYGPAFDEHLSVERRR